MLNENLNVSDTVSKLTKDVSGMLQERIKNQKVFASKNGPWVLSKGLIKFDVSEYLKGIEMLKIRYTVYHFKNYDEFESFSYWHSNLFVNFADYKQKKLNLTLVYINGAPYTDFDSSIQHELNHIFQCDNGQTKNEDFYKKVTDLARNGNQDEQMIGYALYLAFNTEISSFASQYYAWLKQNNVDKASSGTKYHSYDSSNPYHNFDKVFSYVEKLDIDEENLKKKLGISVNTLYSILNNAEKKYMKKMSHAWYKYMTEKKNIDGYIQHINGNKRLIFLMECYDKGIVEEIDEFDDYFTD